MNAKEYLSTIRALDIQIKQKTNELDELRAIATTVRSFDYSRDRVQTSPDGEAPFAKQAERLVELSSEIDTLTNKYSHMISVMNEVCHDVLTADEYMIVSLRYFHNWRWSDIMRIADRRDRTIYRICSKALDKLQDIVISP